ncbi:MAG TPA: hypothetical protein PLX89_21315 [Verrucomicrobiota bacterium]|nr:hypothetical protein [Verrucomicrobiota bacterium]
MNLRSLSWLVGSFLVSAARGESPAPPPAVTAERPLAEVPPETRRVSPAAEETLYSVGDPTDEEQMYLELINYVRADPAGEAQRLASSTDPDVQAAYAQYGVDLNKFVTDTSAYPVAPPLAFEPRLIQAARGHSQWMKTTGTQAHDETNPKRTTGDRINAVGYPWRIYGESIFAYSHSPWHGHAGFEVDWGDTVGSVGGMQNPPGHRNNNHEPRFREAGVGVLNGNGPNNTGPQFVTIDFSARANQAPLVTGVVYYDLNSNQRYDVGEGVGGITVNVSDSSSYAVTTASGAYAVPTSNGARSVSFIAPNLAVPSIDRTVANSNNLKVDLVLPYVAPTISGFVHVPVGVAATYSFTPVAGVTSYRWRRTTVSDTPPSFDASNGLAGLRTTLEGTPTPLVSRTGGGQVYHLTHAEGLTDEIMEIDLNLRPKAGASIRFLSRLGYAAFDQRARVEVSVDQGVTWAEVWGQNGSDGQGEAAYSQRTASLGAYSGQLIRVRFRYGFHDCTTCSLYDQTGNGFGFHFDNVEFVATESLVRGEPVDVPGGTSFSFAPPSAGKFELDVQPVKTRGTLPFGPALALDTDAVALPSVTIYGVTVGPSGKVRVDFTATGATGTPALLQASALNQTYTPVSANLRTNSPGDFSFQYQPPAGSGFLRVVLP